MVNEMRAARQEAPKSVLERVFALLDCFTADEPELTLAELAARTAIPRSTVHRLTKILVDQRLLKRTGSGFSLGLRQFELGELVEDRRKLRDASLPSIQELFEHTHETVHLGVLDGADVLYFVKVVGYHAFPLPTRAGGRWPVHSSALGKALMAFEPPRRLHILTSDLKPLTPYTITQPHRLLDQLETVRKAGVAFEYEESVVGNACVAAPIFNAAGKAVAAISVSGPPLRLRAEQRAPIVRRAAAKISRQLSRNPD
jgi:IclR family transcriptional regulator, acetate operon repressor